MTTETTQVETESANEAVRDDVKHILVQTRDAVRNIEADVDELNANMVKLILALPGRDEVAALADDLGAEANKLFTTFDESFERLRREIAAAGIDDDGCEDDDDDEPAFRFEA